MENIFAASPDAITVSDLNGNVIQCNKATLDMLGFSSKEELIGQNGFSLIAKRDHQKAAEYLKKTFEQGSVKNAQYTFLTQDGHEIQAELSASVIRDALGNPTGFVSVTKEYQTQIEKALRESEEKNRKTIVNANVGIIAYGPEGEVNVLNPKMEEMIGFNRTEIPTLAKWFEKLYPNEEERRKVKDNWFKRMSGEGEVKEGHAIITTKEGKRRNFLFNAVQLESGDSIAFAHDITERKKAEEALRGSEEKWRSLAENAPNIIIIVDRLGTIQFINRTVVDARPEEIVGKSIYDFIGPEHHNVSEENH